MADILVTSGKVKLIKDLPKADVLNGYELTAAVQQGATKQTTISDIGDYTKTLEHATWVYTNSGVITNVQNLTSNWNSVYSRFNILSSVFNSNYTNTNNLSGNWNSVYSFQNTNSANINQAITWTNSNSSFLVRNNTSNIIYGDLVISGSLSATGSTTFTNTVIGTTSSLNISNNNPSIVTLSVAQASGSNAVARFTDGSVTVLHLGAATDINGNLRTGGLVGIRTRTPNKTLTVSGEISANNDIWSSGFFRGDGRFITSLSGSNIVDNTIPLSKLTGTIEIGGLIPAGTITGSQLSPTANIQGTQLAIGTITNNQIADTTITADKMALGTITASQIASNAGIAGSQLNNGSIYNDQIATNTISWDRLSTGGPAWDTFGNLSTTGSIYAARKVSTGDAILELGLERTGNGNSVINFHSRAATGFETEIRRNSGENGDFRIQNTGTGQFIFRQVANAPIIFITSNTTEKLRIHQDFVAVNYASETQVGKFSVYNNTVGDPLTSGTTDSNVTTRFRSGETSLDFGANTSGHAWIQNRSWNSLGSYFDIALQPRGGNVFIGKTAPANQSTFKLDVNGNTLLNGSVNIEQNIRIKNGRSIQCTNAANNLVDLITLDNNNILTKLGSSHVFKTIDNNTTVATFSNGSASVNGTLSTGSNLTVTGTIVATNDITAFSDERLKKNVKTIQNALEKVTELRGVEYEKNDSDKKHIGVIAQEVEKVIPEVVLNNEEYKSVAYGNIVGLLIEAIKDLNKKVESLEEQLKNKN